MNIILVIVIGCVILTSIGLVMGYSLSKIIQRKRDKKLLKQLNEVLEGKKENVFEYEGKKYPVERFILKDENDKEYIIDLKGGKKIIKNEKQNNSKEEEGRIEKKDNSDSGKDSRSSGEEKRITRTRLRRIRKFG